MCWITLPAMTTALTEANLSRLDSRVRTPRYDRHRLRHGIVHLGVGGFHRSHQAEYLEDLCDLGHDDWSITGAGLLDTDAAMAAALDKQDGLYTLVAQGHGNTSVRVVGCLRDYIHAHPDTTELVRLLSDPATRIVSLTITEGGYPVGSAGEITDDASPAFEVIAEALRQRRQDGNAPFAIMSCDNILHNGSVTRTATVGVAARIDKKLASWIEANVAFPSTMVDRITPATSPDTIRLLETEYGLADEWPVVAEPFRQWVVEDDFPLGRPAWEDVGVLLTDDVEPYELLKLRILNAGHSTMAYLAALDGIEFVDEATVDPVFGRYLQGFLDSEAGPVIPPVGGIDVEDYKAQVIRRFSNADVKDQIARLCLDGSAKFPVFLIPTIEAQLKSDGNIALSTLALAGWCQYLLGADDEGRRIEVAHDPLRLEATEFAKQSLRDPASFLDFAVVFPSELAQNTKVRDAFARALESLRSQGARATVAQWLEKTETGAEVRGN